MALSVRISASCPSIHACTVFTTPVLVLYFPVSAAMLCSQRLYCARHACAIPVLNALRSQCWVTCLSWSMHCPRRAGRRSTFKVRCQVTPPGLLGLAHQLSGCAMHSGRATEPPGPLLGLQCGHVSRPKVANAAALNIQAPPEAQLQLLMERNQLLGPDEAAVSSCVHRWKEGGCRHCPRWGELGELWRGAAERRRGGWFMPLAPSTDSEWDSILTAAQAEGGADAGLDGGRGTWWAQRLQQRWLRAPAGVGQACSGPEDAGARCTATRWEWMLCSQESWQDSAVVP